MDDHQNPRVQVILTILTQLELGEVKYLLPQMSVTCTLNFHQAIEKGRYPTPSELHLYVHTHGHDGKSFVDEHARIVHERYEEILHENIDSQSDIDQLEVSYQVADGERREEYIVLDLMQKVITDQILMIPIFVERIRSEISLPSYQSDTPVDGPSSATPIVSNRVVSEDDRISSPEN